MMRTNSGHVPQPSDWMASKCGGAGMWRFEHHGRVILLELRMLQLIRTTSAEIYHGMRCDRKLAVDSEWRSCG